MERRDFVRALVAGGMLGAGNWAARAQARSPTSGGTASVAIVIQHGMPLASELADGIRRALATAGLGLAAITPAQWWQYPEAAALLDRPHGSWLIGVTQDAAAEICQAVAATRGSACVLHAHHRIGRHDMRHCCTSPAVDEALVWSERRSARSDSIGRLYAEALGTPLPTGHDSFAPPPAVRAADADATSLTSFLILI